jgi:DNA-binding NtrC family response regulator
MSDRTAPLMQAGTPVRRLRVQIVSGPDDGESRATTDAVTVGTAASNDLVISDKTVSRFHLELRRDGAEIVVVDHGSTNGTRIGSVTLRSCQVRVLPGTIIEIGSTRVRVDDGDVVLDEPGPKEAFGILGRSTAMRRLLATVTRAAASDVAVLVLGESGSGKELIGRALHEGSGRAREPFVTVDCGSLSPTLFASELFGHERGAFTGAHRRHIGAFERAHRGTVFLDEVGELPADLQSALLGVLERKTFRRLGGSEDIRSDVRVVSATSRDLRAQVNSAQFRLDLFYRLAVVLLRVPPLRERVEDIPLLVDHFLRDAGRSEDAPSLFPAAQLDALKRHDWPGNVRELRNVVLGTLALGGPPQFESTQTSSGEAASGEELPTTYREARQLVVERFEREYLQRLLAATNGNIREAARRAQMNRSYLMEILKRHGMR